MEYIDYQKYLINNDLTWEEIYDYSLSYPENIRNFIQRTNPHLPKPELQEPILLAYFLLPSALCSNFPIMFVHGESGSGKSQLGFLASYIHGVDVYGPGTTYASIRNEINANKHYWLENEQRYIEKHFFCVWDDIDLNQFNPKENMFRLFKCGAYRASDLIVVSGSTPGKNQYYHVGCPKLVSSIHPIYAMPNCSELKRRCIVIRTQKHKGSFDFSIDHYKWIGFSDLFYLFWNTHENVINFIDYRKKLSRQKLNERYRLCIDLLVTGVIVGSWDSIDEGINIMSQYWDWFDENLILSSSSLILLLKDFLVMETRELSPDQQTIISPKRLKLYLDKKQKDGEVDTTLTPEIITQSMNSLGWKLLPNKWVKI